MEIKFSILACGLVLSLLNQNLVTGSTSSNSNIGDENARIGTMDEILLAKVNGDLIELQDGELTDAIIKSRLCPKYNPNMKISNYPVSKAWQDCIFVGNDLDWLISYFCCEGYKSSKGSLVQFLNEEFNWRIMDVFIKEWFEQYPLDIIEILLNPKNEELLHEYMKNCHISLTNFIKARLYPGFTLGLEIDGMAIPSLAHKAFFLSLKLEDIISSLFVENGSFSNEHIGLLEFKDEWKSLLRSQVDARFFRWLDGFQPETIKILLDSKNSEGLYRLSCDCREGTLHNYIIGQLYPKNFPEVTAGGLIIPLSLQQKIAIGLDLDSMTKVLFNNGYFVGGDGNGSLPQMGVLEFINENVKVQYGLMELVLGWVMSFTPQTREILFHPRNSNLINSYNGGEETLEIHLKRLLYPGPDPNFKLKVTFILDFEETKEWIIPPSLQEQIFTDCSLDEILQVCADYGYDFRSNIVDFIKSTDEIGDKLRDGIKDWFQMFQPLVIEFLLYPNSAELFSSYRGSGPSLIDHIKNLWHHNISELQVHGLTISPTLQKSINLAMSFEDIMNAYCTASFNIHYLSENTENVKSLKMSFLLEYLGKLKIGWLERFEPEIVKVFLHPKNENIIGSYKGGHNYSIEDHIKYMLYPGADDNLKVGGFSISPCVQQNIFMGLKVGEIIRALSNKGNYSPDTNKGILEFFTPKAMQVILGELIVERLKLLFEPEMIENVLKEDGVKVDGISKNDSKVFDNYIKRQLMPLSVRFKFEINRMPIPATIQQKIFMDLPLESILACIKRIGQFYLGDENLFENLVTYEVDYELVGLVRWWCGRLKPRVAKVIFGASYSERLVKSFSGGEDKLVEHILLQISPTNLEKLKKDDEIYGKVRQKTFQRLTLEDLYIILIKDNKNLEPKVEEAFESGKLLEFDIQEAVAKNIYNLLHRVVAQHKREVVRDLGLELTIKQLDQITCFNDLVNLIE